MTISRLECCNTIRCRSWWVHPSPFRVAARCLLRMGELQALAFGRSCRGRGSGDEHAT